MTEESIFYAALEKSSTTERHAFLDTACGGDAALRARLQVLLEADARQRGLLDRSAPSPFFPEGSGNATGDHVPSTALGTVIAGRYKLMEKIGEGGFGLVFVAEQQEPVRRRVALKIIKPGMDSAQIIARFESERQALAMMDHQNIAKVHDAGATDNGRPFFVMELVHGVPITDYCDANKLTPRQRLELFVPICHAIQHAHQKGIIHRDIKPSNLLVTMYDDKPVPKVIDFGVAKAIEQRLTERTIYTQFGTLVGTFEYMSPEQAEMNAFGVDTRSDIYSLGVLLYELLTGTTPLERARLRAATFDEIRRIIKEEEPPRPSARLSTSDTLAKVAAARQTDPGKLTRLMRGELDWVVMKCLEKDRTRRYETASDLARDVDRYLDDEPVQARPPSFGYRFGKMARRHKRALATGALMGMILLIAVGAVASSIGWRVRDQEARRAKLAGQLELILAEVGDREAEQKWPEALAAARRAEALVAGGGGDAALERQVRQVLVDLHLIERLEEIRLEREANTKGETGYAWKNRAYASNFRDAGVDIERMTTEQLVERLRTQTHLAVAWAAALDDWAVCRINLRDVAGANILTSLAQAIDPDSWRRQVRAAWANQEVHILEELASSENLVREPPATLRLVGMVLCTGGKRGQGIAVLHQAQRQHPGDFWINRDLALQLLEHSPDHRSEALASARAALAIRPHSAGAWIMLGNVQRRIGQHNDALASYRKAIEMDAGNAVAHSNVGATLSREGGNLEEAVTCFRRAIDLDPRFVGARVNLGNVLRKQKKLDDALACYRQAIDIDAQFAAAYGGFAVTLFDQGKLSDAVAPHRKAIELDPNHAVTRFQFGNTLRDLNQLDDAAAAYKKAIELDPALGAAYRHLGIVLQRQGKLETAVVCWRKAIELEPGSAVAQISLGLGLFDQQKFEDAIVCFKKAADLDPKDIRAHHNLGTALRRVKRFDEALASYRKAIEIEPKDTELYIFLGAALCDDMRDYQGAAAAFQEAIRLSPSHASAHFNLGNALAGQKQWHQACDAYRKAIEFNPADAKAHYSLGMALTLLGERPEAIESLKRSVELDPNFVRAFLYLGRAFRGDKKSEQAIAYYKRAIELEPANIAAHRELAFTLHYDQKKLDDAIAAYRKAAQLDPKSVDVHINLGHALLAQKKLDEAADSYRKVIELHPKYADAHYAIGQTVFPQKKWDEAIAAYRKAIELNPRHAAAHAQLGQALQRKGQIAEAIAAWKGAVAINSKNVSAHTCLAWHLATAADRKLRDVKAAVAHARQAVDLARADANTWSNLGVALLRTGDIKAAVDALEKADLMRKGGDHSHRFFLAMAYWQQGDKDKARQAYEQGVQWMDKNQPSNEELRRFRAEAAAMLNFAEKR